MTPAAAPRKKVFIAVLVFLSLGIQPTIRAQTVPLCQPNELTLSVDDGHGRFDGMSQSGMVLTITHHGVAACSLPLRPELKFQNSHHEMLAVSPQPIRGMSPGPVLIPITLPAQASAASEVRWVSGEVYDHSRCVTPAYVALQIGANTVSAPFKGHLCGPSESGPTYKATLFKLVD